MNVLFFAKYANPKVDIPKEDDIYYKYHQDIYKILKTTDHNIIPCDNFEDLLCCKNLDYIFTLYNRSNFRNSEIFVSELAEYYKIPYLGARPNIRAMAEDKCCAKLLAKYLCIKTPNWYKFECNEKIEKSNFKLSFPCIVKPRYGSSSRFVETSSIVYSFNDLEKQVAYLYENNNDIIIEQFINGTVYTVPLILDSSLNPLVLPAVKEESSAIVSTYLQKRYIENGLKRSIEHDAYLNTLLTEYVLKFYEFIKPIDYARFDFIVKDDNAYFLEFNLGCNLGRKAAIALSANDFGISYEELIKGILINSINRQTIKLF